MSYIKQGQEINGFVAQQIFDVDEYQSRAVRYLHVKSGCRLLHLSNNSVENGFMFAFKTPPNDSRGLPHIVEHAVFSGSRLYPIKDPFQAMLRGSVNTYLNAVTCPDSTLYPAASSLAKDYFNLLRVYADALFFPLLREETFRQEGVRFFHDQNNELKIGGVVFNEINASYFSHTDITLETAARSLFPDNCYRFDSGGDPREVVKLSYRQFLDFYKNYYHPGNCLILLYGNIAAEPQLKLLDNSFLCHFDKQKSLRQIETLPQQAWRQRRVLSFNSGGSYDKPENTVSVNWLTVESNDPINLLSLKMIDHILLGSEGAPLYKALSDSGLAEDISPISGVDADFRQALFSVALHNLKEVNADRFYQFIFTCLDDIIKKPLDKKVVEAAFFRLRFSINEIKGGYPLPLRVLGNALRGLLHGDRLMENLSPNKNLQMLYSAYRKEPDYFNRFIQEKLLDNPHHTLVTVCSQPSFTADMQQVILRNAEQVVKQRQKKDPMLINKEQQKLMEFLQQDDDPLQEAAIPRLALNDIPRQIEKITLQRLETAGIEHWQMTSRTNGVIYANLHFSVAQIAEQDRIHLPFLGRLLTGAALDGIDYDELSRRMTALCGGWHITPTVLSQIGSSQPRLFLSIGVKTFAEQLPRLFDLLFQILSSGKLAESERLARLLKEGRNAFRSSLLDSGNSYCLLKSNMSFSSAAVFEERWRGVEQLEYLDKLSGLTDNFNHNERYREKLAALLPAVFCRDNLLIHSTCETDDLPLLRSRLSRLADKLPERHGAADQLFATAPRTVENVALLADTPLSHTAATFRGLNYNNSDYSLQQLLATILNAGRLWEELRMVNGAYGAWAFSNGIEKTFSFSTYRDPDPESSLRFFRRILSEIAVDPPDPRVIADNVITLAGKELKPLAPASLSSIAFNRRICLVTDETRQRHFDRLFTATPEDIACQAARLADSMEKTGVFSVLSNREAAAALSERHISKYGWKNIDLGV